MRRTAKKRKPIPRPLARFKIFPETIDSDTHPKATPLWFNVVVFKTKKQMERYLVAHGGRDDCYASVLSYDVWTVKPGGPAVLTGELGTIAFHSDYLTMGCMTHEATHAAIAWARRVKLNFRRLTPSRGGACSETEERFCHALGNIARQIVLGLNDHNL